MLNSHLIYHTNLVTSSNVISIYLLIKFLDVLLTQGSNHFSMSTLLKSCRNFSIFLPHNSTYKMCVNFSLSFECNFYVHRLSNLPFQKHLLRLMSPSCYSTIPSKSRILIYSDSVDVQYKRYLEVCHISLLYPFTIVPK